jgi:hypothetical protein
MNIVINPGTEARNGAQEANALVVAQEIAKTFKEEVEGLKLKRDASRDDKDGWYGFTLTDGKTSVDVDIPGDDPEEVMKGEPFVSRRLYVDGSSWLFGFAIGIIADRFGVN